MSKVTLSTIGNIQTNPTTATATINDDINAITTAFDNTLSRDGTSPNTMKSNLDMNSYQILNLPAPIASSSPLRLQDLNSFVGGGTVTNIPAGGVTNSILMKTSNTDYQVGWENAPWQVVNPSSGNFYGPGYNNNSALVWSNSNVQFNNDVIQQISTDPSSVAVITLGGTATVGDVITLNFIYSSKTIPVTYTVKSGDTTSNGNIVNGLISAIANNSTLFNLNGGTVSGGVVVPPSSGIYGGYSTGCQLGYIVTLSTGNSFAFDYNAQNSMSMSYSVSGSATETITFPSGFFNTTQVNGGSTVGTVYQLPNSFDNNPAIVTGRFVNGLPPPTASVIFALYATGGQSVTPNSRSLNYGNISHWVGNSTTGSLKSAWLLQTVGTSGAMSGGWWFGQGIYANAGGSPFSSTALADLGIGTINLPTQTQVSNAGLYFNNADVIKSIPASSQFVVQTSNSLVLAGSLGIGFNTTPTGNTFTTSLGMFVEGVQAPTTGSGLGLSGGTTPSIQAKNYGTSTSLPLTIGTTGATFTSPSGSSLTIAGSTSGTLTLEPAAVSGSSVITFPSGITDFSSTGGTSQVVKQTSVGAPFTVGQLAASDLSNLTTGSGKVVLSTNPSLAGLTCTAQLNVNYSSANFTIEDTGTSGFAFFQIIGQGGGTPARMRVGSESSAGGTVFSGSSPSAGVLGTADNNPLQFFTNNALRLGISSAGISTFTNSFGYATGAGTGSSVIQTTSRTTGVTINTPTGAITLFSAAGSTTATTFTVTNSSVSATDVVHINQKSGTNLYNVLVTSVNTGSFNVTFYTTGGTSTDSPVFNYTVIKGSAN